MDWCIVLAKIFPTGRFDITRSCVIRLTIRSQLCVFGIWATKPSSLDRSASKWNSRVSCFSVLVCVCVVMFTEMMFWKLLLLVQVTLQWEKTENRHFEKQRFRRISTCPKNFFDTTSDFVSRWSPALLAASWWPRVYFNVKYSSSSLVDGIFAEWLWSFCQLLGTLLAVTLHEELYTDTFFNYAKQK